MDGEEEEERIMRERERGKWKRERSRKRVKPRKWGKTERKGKVRNFDWKVMRGR